MSKQCLSCIVLVVFMLMCFEEATSVNYHLDVTIVNSYGKVVKILTNTPTHRNFTIPIGGRYQINITTSVNVPVYITSFDNETLKPIKINDKNSVLVTPSATKEELVYYVPSAPKSNSSTKTPAVTPTEATSTTTDPVILSPGFAVTTNIPSSTDMNIDESTDDVMSTESTIHNATTQGLTVAVTSTKHSTNAAVSQPPTNAVVTQLPTTNVLRKIPTNILIITHSATNISKQNPTDNAKNKGSTKANKDVNKDECKEEKKYIVAIIVLAILLILLLIIIVSLVVYRATKNGKTKTGILHVTPDGKEEDEGETRF